jgi:UDP-GlcNAc:undecaprenyl-phosphate GlcNAc-1-phosphate transferase
MLDRLGLAGVVVLAFAVTAALIPVFARFSRSVGLMDHPSARKIHDRPVPLVGGLAIYIGVVTALLAGGLLGSQIRLFLLASLVVIALGALDDRLDIPSSYRLAVQVVCAGVLCTAGVRFHLTGLGAVDAVVTILWMVGAINAFNCLDCADGIAGTVALAAFGCFAVLGVVYDRHFVSQAAVAGVGAVSAFLLYNRPKARVFLGDTGSTFLGLMAASLAVLCVPRNEPSPSWAAVALVLPFYDIVLVHWRRYRGGLKSVRHLLASTGKDHLPHRLMSRGLGAWGSIRIVAGLSMVAALAAFLLSAEQWLAGSVGLLVFAGFLWRVEGRALPAPRAMAERSAATPGGPFGVPLEEKP